MHKHLRQRLILAAVPWLFSRVQRQKRHHPLAPDNPHLAGMLLAFLDRTGGDGAFTSGAGNVLATAPYRVHQVSDIDNDALIALARRWITQNLGRCG